MVTVQQIGMSFSHSHKNDKGTWIQRKEENTYSTELKVSFHTRAISTNTNNSRELLKCGSAIK